MILKLYLGITETGMSLIVAFVEYNTILISTTADLVTLIIHSTFPFSCPSGIGTTIMSFFSW